MARAPCKAVCLLMMLNPSVNLAKLMDPSQVNLAEAWFGAAWTEAGLIIAEIQPTRHASPHKRRRVGGECDDDDDDDLLDLGSGDEANEATPAHNSLAEMAQFLAMTSSEYKGFVMNDGVRGRRVDLTLMYADETIRKKYPTATLMYESKGSAQITEAYEERVFKFAKATKAPMRSRLSPQILSAFVTIRHNLRVWEMLHGGLDYEHLWSLFKNTKNTTGDHTKPGDETSEDDDATI